MYLNKREIEFIDVCLFFSHERLVRSDLDVDANDKVPYTYVTHQGQHVDGHRMRG